MHIALCHDAIIPPKTYGGTERVIYWLAKALHELGHKTTVIAKAGSRVPFAQFVEFTAGKSLDELMPADVDVAHLWATPKQPPRAPFVVTIEGNGRFNEVFHPNTIFISESHAKNHGARHFVYNGADPNDFMCAKERDDYIVFLAKASWKVKNLTGAIAVARASGTRLEVLGSRNWPLQAQRWLPSLRGVRYHGMVDDAHKRKLLSRARALLFPVRWHEPFGIAVIEALFSGCPVFATPYGAMPELVTNQVGHLSPSGAELAWALKGAKYFDPFAVREYARERFDHLTMARSYLKYYERVIRTGHLGLPAAGGAPRANHEASLSSLLPWQPPLAKLG